MAAAQKKNLGHFYFYLFLTSVLGHGIFRLFFGGEFPSPAKS